MEGVGLSQSDLPNSHFLVSDGPMNENGLTISGSTQTYGKDEFFKQSASLNSWSAGNLAANAHDVAKFYYKLLGPNNSILSP